MISALALVLVAATPLADDVPAGTDLVLRVATGELAPEVTQAWLEAAPLVRSWPQLRGAAAAADAVPHHPWLELARQCGVDVAAKGVAVTLVADLDARGAPVLAAIVRGARPKLPAGPEYDERLVEGERAIVSASVVSASIVGGALVVGNERGVQRLVRHLGGPRRGLDREPLPALARTLRREAPVMLAVRLTPELRELLRARLVPLGEVVATLGTATLSADATAVDLVLSAERARDQDAVTGGVRALAAALAASGSGVLALGELAGSLRQVAPQTQLLPSGVDAALFTKLVTGWLRDFRLMPAIHPRPGATEARLEVTSHRGLGAAALVLLGAWTSTPAAPAAALGLEELYAEAETLLFELREAELDYRAEYGAFLPCAPAPAALPRAPMRWPPGGCFEDLGFAPEGLETVLQLEARVIDDKLLVVARADAGGVPAVWLLDETADAVFGPGAPSPEP